MTNKPARAFILATSLAVSGYSQAATVSFDTAAQTVALNNSFSLNIVGTEFPAIVGGAWMCHSMHRCCKSAA